MDNVSYSGAGTYIIASVNRQFLNEVQTFSIHTGLGVSNRRSESTTNTISVRLCGNPRLSVELN